MIIKNILHQFFLLILLVSFIITCSNVDDKSQSKNSNSSTSSTSLTEQNINNEFKIISNEEIKKAGYFSTGDIYNCEFSQPINSISPSNFTYIVIYDNNLPVKIEKYYNSILIMTAENEIKDDLIMKTKIKFVPYANGNVINKKAKIYDDLSNDDSKKSDELKKNTSVKVLEQLISKRISEPAKTTKKKKKKKDGNTNYYLIELSNGTKKLIKTSDVQIDTFDDQVNPFKKYLFSKKTEIIKTLNDVVELIEKDDYKKAAIQLTEFLTEYQKENNFVDVTYNLNPIFVATYLFLSDIYKYRLKDFESSKKIEEKLVILSNKLYDKYKCSSVSMFYRAYKQEYNEPLDFALIEAYLSMLDDENIKGMSFLKLDESVIVPGQKGNKYTNLFKTSIKIDVRYLFLMRLSDCYKFLNDHNNQIETLKHVIILVDSDDKTCSRGIDIDFRLVALDSLVNIYSKESSEEKMKELLHHLNYCYDELKNKIKNPVIFFQNTYSLLFYIATCYDKIGDTKKALELYNQCFDDLKHIPLMDNEKALELKNEIKRAIIRLTY